MRVILMAAGVGSRLSKKSNNLPKCLIKAGSETLIHRIIRLWNEAGVTDVTVIVGHQGEVLKNQLPDSVNILENPFYPITNSISSLWFAKDLLEGDVVCQNADLFYGPEVVKIMMNQNKSSVLLCDSTRKVDADYRFKMEGDKITRYGKDLSVDDTDAEYVGMARIDSSFMPTFKSHLLEMIQNKYYNKWWEEVLYDLIPKGIDVYGKDIAGHFWTEIDYIEDLERLQDWIKNNE